MLAAFEKGFHEELEKQAGWMGALGKFVGTVGKPLIEGGGRSLMNNLGRAASRVGPAAGAIAAQYPRAAKAIQWGGRQAAQGVGFSLAMAPFQRRQQVTQVLPYEDQQKAAQVVSQSFRRELDKLGFNGKILGRIGPALEGAVAKLVGSKVTGAKSMALGLPRKKTLWNHPLAHELLSGAKWGLGVGAAQRALTKDDEPTYKIG